MIALQFPLTADWQVFLVGTWHHEFPGQWPGIALYLQGSRQSAGSSRSVRVPSAAGAPGVSVVLEERSEGGGGWRRERDWQRE